MTPLKLVTPNEDRILQPQGRQLNTGQQRPSLNTMVREQQQALQVERQFFDTIPMNTEEPGPPSGEALSDLRPEIVTHARREYRQAEETLPDQGNTTTSKRVPSRSMEDMGSNGSHEQKSR